MRGECPGLNDFWRRCLVINMIIKCHSCNLTFLLPLAPPETGRQLGYYISDSICVNFNACIQKKRKRARCASFPQVFCASLNVQFGTNGPFWPPVRLVLQGTCSTFQGFDHSFYKAISLSSSPSQGVTFQEPIVVDDVSKTVSYFSGACYQCSNLR